MQDFWTTEDSSCLIFSHISSHTWFLEVKLKLLFALKTGKMMQRESSWANIFIIYFQPTTLRTQVILRCGLFLCIKQINYSHFRQLRNTCLKSTVILYIEHGPVHLSAEARGSEKVVNFSPAPELTVSWVIFICRCASSADSPLISYLL